MYKNFTILWIVINAETAQTKNKAVHSISSAEKLGNFFLFISQSISLNDIIQLVRHGWPAILT